MALQFFSGHLAGAECLFSIFFFVDYPFSGFLTRWQTSSELIFWSMHAGASRLLTSLASSLGCTR